MRAIIRLHLGDCAPINHKVNIRNINNARMVIWLYVNQEATYADYCKIAEQLGVGIYSIEAFDTFEDWMKSRTE